MYNLMLSVMLLDSFFFLGEIAAYKCSIYAVYIE